MGVQGVGLGGGSGREVERWEQERVREGWIDLAGPERGWTRGSRPLVSSTRGDPSLPRCTRTFKFYANLLSARNNNSGERAEREHVVGL